MKNATDIQADKDDVLGAFDLCHQPHLNKRQIRKVKRYLLPLLQKDRNDYLVDILWIYLWFDPSDTEAMALLNDIERKTTEPVSWLK